MRTPPNLSIYLNQAKISVFNSAGSSGKRFCPCNGKFFTTFGWIGSSSCPKYSPYLRSIFPLVSSSPTSKKPLQALPPLLI